MSGGIVAGRESLARFPGRAADIFVDPSIFEKPNHLEQSHVSMRNGLDLMLRDIHLGKYKHWGIGKEGKSCLPYTGSSNNRGSWVWEGSQHQP